MTIDKREVAGVLPEKLAIVRHERVIQGSRFNNGISGGGRQILIIFQAKTNSEWCLQLILTALV
jgi:hypothetical protein